MAWKRERIVVEIRKAANMGRLDKQRLAHLERAVASAAPEEAFFALSSIFEDEHGPDANFLEQEYAAILARVLPPFPSEGPSLLRLLSRWNGSVEALPAYLEATLGREPLIKFLSDPVPSGMPTEGIRALKFWLRVQVPEPTPPD